MSISKAHCRTGTVTRVYSRTKRNGIVIGQSRRPGQVLPANSKVDLVVSRGRPALTREERFDIETSRPAST